MITRAGRAIAALIAIALLTSACSGDDDSGGSPPSTRRERPQGPEADLEELSGGNGPFVGAANAVDLESLGYVELEYAASGTATSYKSASELTEDGRWSFEPDAEAPFATRVLIRRPADEKDFSGNVIIEWLNVSGGVDANPDWASLHEEITRRGDVWVGVSAQAIGVIGGPVLVEVGGIGGDFAGKGLKALDPERYGSLEHPGDGFSFDIYTQIARAVWAGTGMGELEPQRLIATGESQSAFALVTYYNGVQPLTDAFDGFLVHSRGSTGLPLVEPGENADIAGSIGGTPALFRTDQDVPVLNIQTEGDLTGVLNSYAARQPDGDNFRLWEVAGTAHADAHLLGPIAESLDCGGPINDGPMHVVAKAALRTLATWVEKGEAPDAAPRLEVAEGDAPTISRDDDGIALGGIRTPPVDVPVAVLSGDPGPNPSIICVLLGTTNPLPDDRLAQLHSSRDSYVENYDKAVDAAIEAGYVLEEDREALESYANPDAITG